MKLCRDFTLGKCTTTEYSNVLQCDITDCISFIPLLMVSCRPWQPSWSSSSSSSCDHPRCRCHCRLMRTRSLKSLSWNPRLSSENVESEILWKCCKKSHHGSHHCCRFWSRLEVRPEWVKISNGGIRKACSKVLVRLCIAMEMRCVFSFFT